MPKSSHHKSRKLQRGSISEPATLILRLLVWAAKLASIYLDIPGPDD